MIRKLIFTFVAVALCVGANGAVFVEDTFTDVDGVLLVSHTGETGATWTELNGLSGAASFDIDIAPSGAAVEGISATTTDYSINKASGAPASADYIVTARILYAGTSGVNNQWSGPLARIPDAATNVTGYTALFSPKGDGVQLWKLTGYGGSVIGSQIGSGAFADGAEYDVSVKCVGSSISGYVQRVSDGQWLASGGTWQVAETAFATGADSTYTAAGSAGLWLSTRTSDAVGTSISQFSAADLAASAGLSISPSTGETGTTPTITLTGTGTSWLSETPAGLFTVSGGIGESIATPTILSDTSATAVLTVGSFAGTLTITDTSTAATADFTAAAPSTSVIFGVDNAAIFWNPYTWFSEGSGALQSNNVRAGALYAWSNQRGAYFKFRATVESNGSIGLNLDTSSLSGISAEGCPTLAWSIGGGARQTALLPYSASEYSLTLGSSLAAGTYDVFVWFQSVKILEEGDEWNTPANRVQVGSIELSANGTISPADIRPNTMIVYGDSITEGGVNLSTPNTVSSQDALATYGWFAAAALDAEVGIVGFYGRNWGWMASSWDSYANGRSRLYSGLLSPAPDYVVINYGENGSTVTATVTATLAGISTAAPAADIILMVPFSGQDRALITAATLPANGHLIDLAPPEMVSGSLFWSYDGQHPNVLGHANLGAELAAAIVEATGGGGVYSFGTFGGGRL